MDVLTRQQVQELDRRAVQQYGIPSIVLMENAGRGVVDVLCHLGIDGPVMVCCGRGNNAGDGFVIARHLDLRQHEVKVLSWSDESELKGDAATNYRILRRSGIPIQPMLSGGSPAPHAAELQRAGWIVDALLGTGARGAPRPPLDQVLRALNAAPAKRLAVDVPTGLDCDTGQAHAVAFRADHTCTFVAPKPGLMLDSARGYVGHLHVVQIGAPRKLVQEILAEPLTRC